ncbi:ABC transporter ATP-binding protein [Halobacillus sp. A5]|uniref:ABC transporter ATP-binding protein n=1 Tax=Halobacillus sp. A5 TaxID=2880263 RepID=UPI0020A66DDD|nr:ABC transporter ATP-binding protein [Halobacillus sp. A5]MCP3027034.1 ABC transporter ATP-binding protein [Halobacillus sp. A5]
MKEVLRIKNVNKVIKGTRILKDINFSVHSGEIVGFVGPNGAGKTSTIKLIVGLSKIEEGEIFICGYNVQEKYSEAIKYVGAISEMPQFYNFMSARKNLIHYAKMNGKVDKKYIEEILEVVDLLKVMDKKVKTFSLGMKQRLGIAQALIHKPSLLILDEPTNGLDPQGIIELRQNLMFFAKNEGIAILISSHIMSELEIICSKVIMISNGEILEIQDLQNNNNTKKNRYVITVDSNQLAITNELVKLYDNNAVVDEKSSNLIVNLQIEKVPDFIRTLSKEVNIYQFKNANVTLEEKYLASVKGRGDRNDSANTK